MNRRTTLLVALALVACTADLPTAPTEAVEPALQTALPPVPPPPTPLAASLPGANGAPLLLDLGVWEAPTLAKITVSGMLSYSGATGGYYAPAGSHDFQGRYVPGGNLCASQLSVRIHGVGPVGGAYGYCPASWQSLGSLTRYAVISGAIYATRTAPAPGACYYGTAGCATISGSQEVTVTPVEGAVAVLPETTIVRPGAHTRVKFRATPVQVGGVNLPFTLREVTFVGSGPVVGGGTTKACGTKPTPTECIGQFYQSGYVEGTALVSGVLRTGRAWITVVGGDSVPPPPVDTLPTDTIPTDTLPPGGGGGGCVAPLLSGISLGDCGPPNDSSVVQVTVETSRAAVLPVFSPCFDAKTQIATSWNCTTAETRRDTVRLRVRATYSGKLPAGGIAVELTSVYSRNEGDHAHPASWGQDSLLAGRFIDPSTNVSPPTAGSRRTRRIVLGKSGDTTIIYRTAGVAGTEQIFAKVDTTSLKPGTGALRLDGLASVRIAVDGLEELEETGNVDTIGPTDAHPDSHWGTPEMNTLLRELADSIAARRRQIDSMPPARRPSGRFPSTLAVNDMSLPNGGVFDFRGSRNPQQAWAQPHLTHRDGLHADVDIRATEEDDVFSAFVRRIWQVRWSLAFVDERASGNHVHLAYQERARATASAIRGIGGAIALCTVTACTSTAQSTTSPLPADSSAAVTVDSIWRDGPDISIAYTVRLAANWAGRMEALLLQPGVPLAGLSPLAPARWMGGKVRYSERDAIEWVDYNPRTHPAAGQTVSGFLIRGRFRVGEAPYLIQRYSAPDLTSEAQLGDPPPLPPLWTQGVSGLVLGPAAPLASEPSQRAEQLVADFEDWCSASSVVPRGICQSLTRKAGEVRDAATTGNVQELERTIRVLRAEMDAQRGKHLPEATYWWLVADLIAIPS